MASSLSLSLCPPPIPTPGSQRDCPPSPGNPRCRSSSSSSMSSSSSSSRFHAPHRMSAFPCSSSSSSFLWRGLPRQRKGACVSSPLSPPSCSPPSACQPPRGRAAAAARGVVMASAGGVSGHVVPPPLPPPASLAVFVSGGGSNLRSIHSVILDGRINAHVSAVVSDKPECGGCQYALAQGMRVLAFPRSPKFAPLGLDPPTLVAQLKSLGVQYVVLAGYLKLVPLELVRAYPRSILNIHPALLPAFGGKGYYGIKVHQAVIQSGARFSGPTIHFVDEKYDHGPIVAQSVVPVFHTDTPKDLQQRVLKEEHRLYPEVLAALCQGRVAWRDDGVPYIVEVVDREPALL